MKKKKEDEKAKNLSTCGWCGNRDENKKVRTVIYQGKLEPVPLCDDECHDNLVAFGERTHKKLHEFLMLWILVMVAGFILVLANLSGHGWPVGILLLFVGNGILLITYPFVPIRTVEVMGASKGARLSKILGTVNILLGIVFFLILLKFAH